MEYPLLKSTSLYKYLFVKIFYMYFLWSAGGMSFRCYFLLIWQACSYIANAVPGFVFCGEPKNLA